MHPILELVKEEIERQLTMTTISRQVMTNREPVGPLIHHITEKLYIEALVQKGQQALRAVRCKRGS
jgi:hypothetical protein